jgi:hypothetical protein
MDWHRWIWNAIKIPLGFAMIFAAGTSLAPTGIAQSVESLGNGLRQIQSNRLTLITDLPIDDDLKEWPNLLDQAIEQWRDVWQIPSEQTASLRLTAYLIADRGLFERAGLLNGVPEFEDGYQLNDSIYFMQQPSSYYRRHLFLHEATHWIMYRFFGGAGSPWFMEGTAELFGTHRLAEDRLTLNTIPSDPSQVPNWGRLKRIREMLDDGTAPSLREILAYGNDLPRRNDRYVWSWAATVFFWNHPQYSKALLSAASPPLDYSMDLSNRLEQALEKKWPSVLADWNVFVSDFDFGYEPQRSMIDLGSLTQSPKRWDSLQEPVLLELASDRGWQDSGIDLQRGNKIRVMAEGTFTIAQQNSQEPWDCGPNGITFRYFQHQPMGKLLATIVPMDGDASTCRLTLIPIGKEQIIEAPHDGRLLLKINEPAGQIADNAGTLTLTLQASP